MQMVIYRGFFRKGVLTLRSSHSNGEALSLEPATIMLGFIYFGLLN